jgi:ribose transport system permease protein
VKRRQTNQATFGATVSHLISVWSLLILLVALVVAFSIIKPDTFPTYFNFRSIVNNPKNGNGGSRNGASDSASD